MTAKLAQVEKERDELKEDLEKQDCGHPYACVEHQQGPEDADEVCLWCAQLGGSEQVAEYEKGLLQSELSSQEADFQARLAPWVAAVGKASRSEDVCECDSDNGECLSCLLRALLSSPDALSAQAREAEIRAAAFEEAASMLSKRSSNEPALTPGAIRLRWARKFIELAADERAKAKAADKTKEVSK